MKWVIVIIVAILAAPTIAKRLEALNPESAARSGGAPPKRRSLLYRAVRRFGPRVVLTASVLLVAILAVAVYLLVQQF